MLRFMSLREIPAQPSLHLTAIPLRSIASIELGR